MASDSQAFNNESNDEIEHDTEDLAVAIREKRRIERERKVRFKTLGETMDENNYDTVPHQPEEMYESSSKDKKKKKNSWDTVVSNEGRRGNEQIIHNKPGPSRKTQAAKSRIELLDLIYNRRND